MVRHVLVGSGAGLLLLLLYLALLSLLQGPVHALTQLRDQWYWILPLTVGLGTQAGLYSFIRHAMRARKTAAGVAASGGMSAGSMAACCAHHLSDVLPALGISGLAAFLVDYQPGFFILGILSNIVGITLMLETMQRHRLSERLEHFPDMSRLRRFILAGAGAVGAMAFAVMALSLNQVA